MSYIDHRKRVCYIINISYFLLGLIIGWEKLIFAIVSIDERKNYRCPMKQ